MSEQIEQRRPVCERHRALSLTWVQGQQWETKRDECEQWVLVADGGFAEPVWDPKQDYRERVRAE